MDKITIEKLTKFTYDSNETYYMYPGGSWTYQIIIDNTPSVDTNIPITYYGSGITNDVDFVGPTNVIIKAGTDRVKFNISLLVTDNVFEKHFKVTSTYTSGQDTVSSYVISRTSCPWYTEPKSKIHCEPMIGLPTEYQENYCDNRDSDTYRNTGPACKDIYFWDMTKCKDAFIGHPPRYPE